MKGILLLTYLFLSLFSFGQAYEVEEVRLVATIQTINGINHSTNEFSPLARGKKIYFTSSRQFNNQNIGEDNWSKYGYDNIFYGNLRNDELGVADVKDIKLLSNRLNFGNHAGPISFSTTGDTLFFTRVVQVSGGKERLYRPQLYSAVNKKGKWTKIKALPFSNNESSYGHPSFDPSTNRLYFASDKPGGKGGDDIYYSELKNGEWGALVNMVSLNTTADEKFPFVVGGNIFYASNREGGQGQLDIYYSAPKTANYPIKLEGINSASDDFGISILSDLSAGFFSSNRTGNDDIYYFTLERKIKVKNELAGTFTFRTLGGAASNLTVQLYNQDGEFVYEEKTDDKGYFKFKDIELDSNFSVKIDGLVKDEMTLDFYDGDGNPTASYILDESGAFKYKKLFYESGGIIRFIPEDMVDFNIGVAELSGKLLIEDEPNNPLKNQRINLVDKGGNVVRSQMTDLNGNFSFDDLAVDSTYFVQVAACSEELLMYIYGADNNIFTQLKCNAQDQFEYRRLATSRTNNLKLIDESVEGEFLLNSSELSGRFERNDDSGLPIQCKVRVYDDSGILLATTETDSLGFFKFDNLSIEKSYKFTGESSVPLQLTLFNRYGKEVAKLQEEENNYFIFRPLGYQTEYGLSLMDDKLKFDLNQSEKYEAVLVYFDVNKDNVKSVDMNKVGTILKILKKYPQLQLSISAYADASASDEYNFILSQKRGEWIVNYLVSQGININRLTINAYGETKLVDPDNDALNRRAELRIYM